MNQYQETIELARMERAQEIAKPAIVKLVFWFALGAGVGGGVMTAALYALALGYWSSWVLAGIAGGSFVLMAYFSLALAWILRLITSTLPQRYEPPERGPAIYEYDEPHEATLSPGGITAESPMGPGEIRFDNATYTQLEKVAVRLKRGIKCTHDGMKDIFGGRDQFSWFQYELAEKKTPAGHKLANWKNPDHTNLGLVITDAGREFFEAILLVAATPPTPDVSRSKNAGNPGTHIGT